MENQQTKRCPFCAEEIQFAAVKCKHCGSDLMKTNGGKKEIEVTINKKKKTSCCGGIGAAVIIFIIIGAIASNNDSGQSSGPAANSPKSKDKTTKIASTTSNGVQDDKELSAKLEANIRVNAILDDLRGKGLIETWEEDREAGILRPLIYPQYWDAMTYNDKLELLNTFGKVWEGAGGTSIHFYDAMTRQDVGFYAYGRAKINR